MSSSTYEKQSNISQNAVVAQRSKIPVPTTPADTTTKPTLRKSKAHYDFTRQCTIRPARVPHNKIQSTFTASYPGSGAKMTWKLIEGITGLGQ